MANLHDDDQALVIVDRIDHPVVALPDAVLLLARQLLTARGPGIGRQRPDPLREPLAVSPGGAFKLLDRARLYENAIACHAA